MNTFHKADYDDSEAMRYLRGAGISDSTAQAYARDMRYFWAWASAAIGFETPKYPVLTPTLQLFVRHHLICMPPYIANRLVSLGYRRHSEPLKARTIKRYLASVAVEHLARGLPNPFDQGEMKFILKRASRRQGKKKLKAITADVLYDMVKTCGNDPRSQRDRALLMVAFASGGRRRSELVALRVEDLHPVEGGYLAHLPEHKTQATTILQFPIVGEACEALTAWLTAAGITEGFVFRRITRGGKVRGQLGARAVYRIVHDRLKRAGYDTRGFGPHSLRIGFITEAARNGVSLPEAMALSHHKSIAVALEYYREGEILDNPAAHLPVKPRLRISRIS